MSIMLFVFALITACGGKKEEEKKTEGSEDKKEVAEEKKEENTCSMENKIKFSVDKYKYNTKGDLKVDGDFEVKSTWYEDKSTDKMQSYTIYLANYENARSSSPSKDSEMVIEVKITAKNGKKIEPKDYPHSGDGDYLSFTVINTTKGKVYFNWLAGMPRQGTVIIDNIDAKGNICGVFRLKVDKPENDKIGTVVLEGNFSASKK